MANNFYFGKNVLHAINVKTLAILRYWSRSKTYPEKVRQVIDLESQNISV